MIESHLAAQEVWEELREDDMQQVVGGWDINKKINGREVGLSGSIFPPKVNSISIDGKRPTQEEYDSIIRPFIESNPITRDIPNPARGFKFL